MTRTEKQDDRTTTGELNPMPDLARPSDAEYGTRRLAKEAADYAALNQVRKIYRAWRAGDMTHEQALHDIGQQVHK